MIRVAAYFREDFDEIEASHGEMIGDLTALKDVIMPEHSRTAFHGSRPIAAAGVVPIWPGMGQGWVIVDNGAPEKFSLVRAMRRGMRDIAKNGPFHRIQADVRRDFDKGQKFLRMLGFTYEGPLDAYSEDGKDYERFAFVSRELIEVK